MLILGVVVLLCAVCLLLPNRGAVRIWFAVGVLTMAALYLFFAPPPDFDLFRHFDLMDTLRSMSYQEIFLSDWEGDSAQMADYLDSSRGYLFLLFLVSHIGPNVLLPALTAAVVYGLLLGRVWQVGRELTAPPAVLALTFAVVLLCINFRDISGVRNMLAYAVFAYVLYEDLVNRRNTVICCVIYVLLCELHMSCIVLVILRVAVGLTGRRSRPVMSALLLMAFTVGGFLTEVLDRLIDNAFVHRFAYKVSVYRFGMRKDFNLHGVIVYLIIIAAFFLIYMDLRRQGRIAAKYEKYAAFCVYMLAFTVGSVQQYHILLRNTQLTVMLFLPFVMLFLRHHLLVERGGLSLARGSRSRGEAPVLLGFAAVTGATLLFYWWIAYLPMDAFFRL